MRWQTDGAATLAVATAVGAMLLGGAFWPVQRAVVGLPLSLVMAAVAALGWAGWTAAERTVVGLVGWSSLAALVVANDRLAAREMVAAYAGAAALWIAARRAGRLRPWLLGVVTVTAVAVATTVLVDAFGGWSMRAGGVFDSPNLAAAVLVPLIPAAYRWLPGRWPGMAAVAGLVAGLVATGSRAAVLAAAAAWVAVLPAGRVRRLVVAAAAVLVAIAIGGRLIATSDALAWHRPAIWGSVSRLALHHPLFGVGPGNLADATGPVRLAHPDRVVRHEHAIGGAESTPLAIAASLGLVGLVLAAFAVGWWLREARRQPHREPARWWLGVAVGVAVVALFHDLLAAESILWWWGAVLGLAVPHHQRPAAPFAYRWPAAVAVVGLGLWGLVTPNVARAVWRSAPPACDRIGPVERLEPALTEPLEWRVAELLRAPSWEWRDAAEATALVDRMVAVRPGVFAVWMWSGRVAARTAVELGAWPAVVERARASFGRAAALEPNLPWGWLARAELESLMGEPVAARSDLDRALAAEPRCTAAWVLVARIELARGRPEAAHAALEQVRESARVAAATGVTTAYVRQVLTVPAWQLAALERELR